MPRSFRDHLLRAYDTVDPLVALSLVGVLLSILLPALLYGYLLPSGTPSISATSAATCSTPSHSPTVTVSTSTVTINLTSTKTIRVSQANILPSTQAVLPLAGLLSDGAADRPQKPTVCSAEVFGKHEILVKIPLSTKTSWLAKDSITIDVYRGEQPIKTKFSSIDEGILIEIPTSEAHGLLNVDINTVRKPKINETFVVDFGKGYLEEMLELGKLMLHDVAFPLVKRGNETVQQLAEMLPGVLENLTGSLMSRFKEAKEAAETLSARVGEEAANTANRVKDSWNADVISKRLKELQSELSHKLQPLEDFPEQLEHSILKAQIRSRLWWLSVQGKMQEHDSYKKKAESYLAKQHANTAKTRKERQVKKTKEARARRKKERREARCQSGFSLWAKHCKSDD